MGGCGSKEDYALLEESQQRIEDLEGQNKALSRKVDEVSLALKDVQTYQQKWSSDIQTRWDEAIHVKTAELKRDIATELNRVPTRTIEEVRTRGYKVISDMKDHLDDVERDHQKNVEQLRVDLNTVVEQLQGELRAEIAAAHEKVVQWTSASTHSITEVHTAQTGTLGEAQQHVQDELDKLVMERDELEAFYQTQMREWYQRDRMEMEEKSRLQLLEMFNQFREEQITQEFEKSQRREMQLQGTLDREKDIRVAIDQEAQYRQSIAALAPAMYPGHTVSPKKKKKKSVKKKAAKKKKSMKRKK